MAKIALCDARGLLNALIDTLSGEDGDRWLAALARFLRKENPWGDFSSSALAAKYGFEVVEDDEPIANLDVAGIEYIPVLDSGEPPITGEVMRQRASDRNANFSLLDGERMLAKQEDIRADRNTYIVLAKTKLRDRGGSSCVAYLGFDGERWYLSFRGLGGVWGGRVRCPRCK